MSNSQSTPSGSTAAGIQASDDQSIKDAIENIREQGIERREAEEALDHKSVIIQLISKTRKAFDGTAEFDPDDLLVALHHRLWERPEEVMALMDPSDDRLNKRTVVQFLEHTRLRAQGTTPPNPTIEFEVAVKVAKALKYIYAYGDTTRYVPVRMERLNVRGAKSPKDGPITPIARRRIGMSQSLDEMNEEVLINHDDCEHALVVALPRKGKDSTITSICGNLKDEHGYKWFSCLEDGRDETPMIAIPSDDPDIRENLDQFNQGPKAYDSRVYVPDTDGLPDVLPSNFHRFTIGIEDLTSRLILRLAGITTDDANTMRRIGQALAETEREGKGVERLIELMYEYAEEVEATITVTKLEQDEWTTDDGIDVVDDAEEVEADPSVREVNYEMGADKAIGEAAESLLMLSGEGLIADPGAESNIDMEAEFQAQDRVAILNCNFLKDRNEPLKYIILNLWLRLIFRARDSNARLPRALLEIRELKDIAPSVLGNSKFQKEVKALQSTIYEIATRGGSRRIMMLGSTQKLNDVYKPVRTNMPIKILLQLGEEEIMSLDRSYNFEPRQIEQLKSFKVGWGMLITDGDEYWPIQWRGARCGLNLGDEEWRDRYGRVWGARVFPGPEDNWLSEHADADAYVNVRTGRVSEIDVSEGNHPRPGEWHLLLGDLFATVPLARSREDLSDGDTIPERVVRTALKAYREHPIPSDLHLTKAETKTERTLTFQGSDEADEERKREVLNQHNVPKPLEGWIGPNMKETRQNMLIVLDAVVKDEADEITSMNDIADASGIPKGTIGAWRSTRQDFSKCLEKRNGVWAVTNVGKRAMKIDWQELDRLMM